MISRWLASHMPIMCTPICLRSSIALHAGLVQAVIFLPSRIADVSNLTSLKSSLWHRSWLALRRCRQTCSAHHCRMQAHAPWQCMRASCSANACALVEVNTLCVTTDET